MDTPNSILIKLDRDGSHLDFNTLTRTANLFSGGPAGMQAATQIDLADLLILFENGWISRYESIDGEHRYRITERGERQATASLQFDMADQAPCAERLRLSNEVVAAVQVVYDARHSHDRAEREKKDTAPYREALAEARSAE